MLDIRFLRENLTEVEKRLALRGGNIGLPEFRMLDEDRRRLIADVERLKQRRNAVSEEIKELDEGLKGKEEMLEKFLLNLPNIPHPSVPSGKTTEDNVEIRKAGSLPNFIFTPREHSEIGERLGILDFERGGKLAGARFTLYKGAGALLERALINFMLDVHTRENGYTEVLPPFMVNRACMTGTGQLP